MTWHLCNWPLQKWVNCVTLTLIWLCYLTFCWLCDLDIQVTVTITFRWLFVAMTFRCLHNCDIQVPMWLWHSDDCLTMTFRCLCDCHSDACVTETFRYVCDCVTLTSRWPWPRGIQVTVWSWNSSECQWAGNLIRQ